MSWPHRLHYTLAGWWLDSSQAARLVQLCQAAGMFRIFRMWMWKSSPLGLNANLDLGHHTFLAVFCDDRTTWRGNRPKISPWVFFSFSPCSWPSFHVLGPFPIGWPPNHPNLRCFAQPLSVPLEEDFSATFSGVGQGQAFLRTFWKDLQGSCWLLSIIPVAIINHWLTIIESFTFIKHQ